MPPLPAFLFNASITDGLVDFAVKIVEKVGLLGIFLMMTLESACIPIPSEPTMLAAGFATAPEYAGEHHLSFVPVIVVATLANVIGSWIGYAIGYYGRAEALEKHKWIHLDPKQLARAEGWYEKHGGITVFITRLLPVVRTFASVPAGAARMPLGRFTLYTAAGCLVWMTALTWAGRSLGAKWRDLQDKLHYVDYAIAAIIVVTAIWLFVRWWRGRGNTPGPAVPSETETAV
ncbi:MAG: DedA family protein [Solirubrobacteraceae bacterium]